MAKILLVDDDELVLYALSKFLRKSGHTIIEAANGLEAMKKLKLESFDLLVTDIIMPDMEGIQLILEAKKIHSDLAIIAISGGGRNIGTSYLSTAKSLGADATLEKPFDEQDLLNLIEDKINH